MKNGLTLPDFLTLQGETLVVASAIRVIPHKRFVGKAIYQEKEVIVKWFYGKNAKRRVMREKKGYDLLHVNGIATPKMILFEKLHENNGFIVLYDYLSTAKTLHQQWNESTPEEQKKWLEKFHDLLQSMYVKGIYQKDIHANNFLCQNNQLYVVDAAEIKKARFCAKTIFLNNKAHAFAQLMPSLASFFDAKQKLFDVSLSQVNHYVEKGKKEALAKCFRNATEFLRKRTFVERVFVRREEATPAFWAMLNHIDDLAKHAVSLKKGRSSTVFIVDENNQRWVVKRYNIKNFFHFIKRCFQSSRAYRNWYFANWLTLNNIEVPKPIAMFEKRIGFLKKETYYISQYIDAIDFASYYASPQHQESEKQKYFVLAETLLNNLYKAGVSHGDMKATNLLVSHNKLYLIDLDGMKKTKNKNNLQKAILKDKARFSKNFNKEE